MDVQTSCQPTFILFLQNYLLFNNQYHVKMMYILLTVMAFNQYLTLVETTVTTGYNQSVTGCGSQRRHVVVTQRKLI